MVPFKISRANGKVNAPERELILSLRRDRNLGARRIQSELRLLHERELSITCVQKALQPPGSRRSSSDGYDEDRSRPIVSIPVTSDVCQPPRSRQRTGPNLASGTRPSLSMSGGRAQLIARTGIRFPRCGRSPESKDRRAGSTDSGSTTRACADKADVWPMQDCAPVRRHARAGGSRHRFLPGGEVRQ